MNGDITNVSIAGAPAIVFRFAGDTCRAELAGAHLYAEVSRDGEHCDLRLTDEGGEILANVTVNPRFHRTLTENLMDIGSALLWSHYRYRKALIEGPTLDAVPEMRGA